jgi:hypothetical protein
MIPISQSIEKVIEGVRLELGRGGQSLREEELRGVKCNGGMIV